MADEQDPEAVPRALGSRYELVERLGGGAMGQVWSAVDRTTGEAVAAKLLHETYAHDTDIVGRFIQERAILMNLRHPGIVRVRDLVVEGSQLAIVMDLVAGGDLRSHLRTAGTLAPRAAVAVTCAVLDALAAAHAAGFLHRDVKPDNVLLVGGQPGDGSGVRLSDFGIARLAQDSTVQATGLVGTPGYMPPELFQHGRFSTASDVYATGILLYELLGGRTPFAGKGTVHTIGNRHVTVEPPPLPVHPLLWSVLAVMLAKDPATRLPAGATARALRDLPDEALDGDPLPRQPDPETWHTAERTVVRSHPALPGAPAPGAAAVAAAAASAPPGHTVDVPFVPSGAVGAGGPDPVPVAPETPETPARREPRRRAVVAVVAAVLVLLAAVLAGSWWAGRDDTGGGDVDAATRATAPEQEAELDPVASPSGLVVARAASYDPGGSTVEVELSLTKPAAAEPTVLVFLPGPADDPADCPTDVAWDVPAAPVDPYTTAVEQPCGWSLGPLPAGTTTLRAAAVVGVDLGVEEGALEAWESDAADLLTTAVADTANRTTAFPAQRVRSLRIEVTPPRIDVDGTASTLLFATWAQGEVGSDPVHDSGARVASGVVRELAGDGLRFATGCDAVAVSVDGDVRGYFPTTGPCEVVAEVGGFVLEPAAVAVVTPST
ncbi:serine/threonine protein kinase [Nocardioides sp. ChNu-153]|uniref:serine/threonine-protein kinase n=3 Tax=unclassified Nocardioides TaxID=2615069 RepID=UPI00264E6568|nr:serine/threonine-protein kinase [Nocardioides sp. ChNu-153]MDN7120499.1 serine/threonine protein kinase [Nocardioides sp. ChNu-153]